MKKAKAHKKLTDEEFKQELDDCEDLPEEMEGEAEEVYEETTEEITVDDFHRFKESLPSDWEG